MSRATLLVVFLAQAAHAQPCITCRTERCPNKSNVDEWCGNGADPQAPQHASDALEVESTPSGATVHLDSDGGPVLGKTPLSLKLRPGRVVVLTRPGYVSQRLETTHRSGRVHMALVRSAELQVSSNSAGAQIYLDGFLRGTAPAHVADLLPGQHVIEVQAPGYEAHREEVTLSPGAKVSVDIKLHAPPPTAVPVPPPPKQAQCPPGQVVTADTAGRCCWSGQVWADGRCVGAPTSCPAGMLVDAVAQQCTAPQCPDGKTRTADGVHCCWPGQAWSGSRALCIGVPACPTGWRSHPELPFGGAEHCFREAQLAASDEPRCGGAPTYACDVSEYMIRERLNVTAEELEGARQSYRLSGVRSCREAAAHRSCSPAGEIGARTFWCCQR